MHPTQLKKSMLLKLFVGGVEINPGPAQKSRKRKAEKCVVCGRFLSASQHKCPGDSVEQFATDGTSPQFQASWSFFVFFH